MRIFTTRTGSILVALMVTLAAGFAGARQETLVRVDLAYRAPGTGPKPNFSPKGTQVELATVAPSMVLPAGAARPAKSGVIKIGPAEQSWIPVLATADADHPHDVARLFVDFNRNGNFTDDGPGFTAPPTQNEKTKAWWTSFDSVELSIPYGASKTREPYLISFWSVRDDQAEVPDVIRYSVRSWRSGVVTVNGVEALVAAMDSDNNAMFDKSDLWSVLEGSAPDAARTVLSITEAKPTNRLMFLRTADKDKDIVLEFRRFSPDGRSIEFAVVDKPVTKTADRAGDDYLATERGRPRTTTAFTWNHDFEATLAAARSTGRKVFIDFEATWCGPCKTMDEWIWTDADVAGLLNAGYVGVKLDGDIEKALVKRFNVKGYPTMVVLDAHGTEIARADGYLSSKATLAFLMPLK